MTIWAIMAGVSPAKSGEILSASKLGTLMAGRVPMRTLRPPSKSRTKTSCRGVGIGAGNSIAVDNSYPPVESKPGVAANATRHEEDGRRMVTSMNGPCRPR